MARIKDLLQDDLILEEIRATDKLGVIHELADRLKLTGKIADAEELVRVIVERESLGSTGIGDGVAIPHGKLRGLGDMIVVFGRSSGGIDFHSLDGNPAYLFFLLVTPTERPGEHLKTLARISRILKNPVLRDNLKRASRREELQQLICEEDGKYPQK
jgi:PTS system nitrogen regulatory IIA component